jgi:SAM-dependent methyltransferase
VKAPRWPKVGTALLSTGDEVDVVLETVEIGAPEIASLSIERPEDPPSLLQDWCNVADPARLIPYWAEIWPAAKAIARRLAAGPGLRGARVLDLGCGLGLTGVAAGLKEGAVTFADNHPDALAFARRNAARAGLRQAEFLLADWNGAGWSGNYDLVLGADVIYERSQHESMVALVERILAPGGRAWFGDPCRDIARGFLEEWTRGHRAETARVEPFPGEDMPADIHTLSL